MKEKILYMLLNNLDDFLSGEKISMELGITRSAVWKHIKNLKDSGYKIESVSSKGYKIKCDMDMINPQIIKQFLKTSFIGNDVLYFDEIKSTNSYAREVANKVADGTVVITDMQTDGKGRMGRCWHADKSKGLCFSIILKPEIAPHEAPFITLVAAASISEALDHFGVNHFIKWPNDIIINNKKVCGILTEMASEIDCINYIVLGIGININNEKFEDDINDIATSLKIEGYDIKRVELLTEIINRFEKYYLKYISDNDKCPVIGICKNKSNLIGQDIFVIKNKNRLNAQCIDLNEKGNLIVKYENEDIGELSSGEVSIRRNGNE